MINESFRLHIVELSVNICLCLCLNRTNHLQCSFSNCAIEGYIVYITREKTPTDFGPQLLLRTQNSDCLFRYRCKAIIIGISYCIIIRISGNMITSDLMKHSANCTNICFLSERQLRRLDGRLLRPILHSVVTAHDGSTLTESWCMSGSAPRLNTDQIRHLQPELMTSKSTPVSRTGLECVRLCCQ